MKKVCVMMSTYNGEKFVEEQILSIVNQIGVEVFLFIRDDGSNDSTVSIIKKLMHRYRNISLFEDCNVGVTRSFYAVCNKVYLAGHEFDYYAFADQDDVWLPEKLCKAVQCLEKFDNKLPNLYYSNLKVVDVHLNYKFERFSKTYVKNTKKQLMAEICVLGCTCVFNYRLFQKMANAREKNAYCHDNWIVWIAMFTGNVYYDCNSYILYRQHGNNESGQVKKNLWYLISQVKKLKNIANLTPLYENLAKSILEEYRDVISVDDCKRLEVLAEYRNNRKYKMKLLFTNYISSGHLIKEISRRIRILLNAI